MKKRYRLKKKPCILLVFSVSILFLFTFNVTSSRYMGQLEGEVEDIVAIPVISMENPTFNYIPKNMVPGYVDESDFFVNNYDNEKQNEVLMKYTLKVTLDSVVPIKVTLTSENGTEINLDEGNKTEEYELSYTGMQKTKYHIKLAWDEKDNSYEYANQKIKISIDLTATQVIED